MEKVNSKLTHKIGKKKFDFNPILKTNYGELVQADSIQVLPLIKDESFDLVFLDPPFNLKKDYGEGINDNLSPENYLDWSKEWLEECVRTLKNGGALFLYQLPEKLIWFGNKLNELGMNFRHWISVEFKSTYPSKNKLYPAHYGMLYYTKGEPKTFTRPKIPIKKCRHCGKDIKDYGGYRKHIEENGGLNLSDVWTDISPVRHKSTKNRDSNELPEKIAKRALKIGSDEGDMVLDPFAGAGTTLIQAEELKRNWFGIELGDCKPIKERFEDYG